MFNQKFNLLAASVADDGTVPNARPETIALTQELGYLRTPVSAECPRQYLQLVIFIVLFHIIRQKP